MPLKEILLLWPGKIFKQGAFARWRVMLLLSLQRQFECDAQSCVHIVKIDTIVLNLQLESIECLIVFREGGLSVTSLVFLLSYS